MLNYSPSNLRVIGKNVWSGHLGGHQTSSPSTGSGRGGPDPAFPLLFLQNPASRDFFLRFPEYHFWYIYFVSSDTIKHKTHALFIIEQEALHLNTSDIYILIKTIFYVFPDVQREKSRIPDIDLVNSRVNVEANIPNSRKFFFQFPGSRTLL